MQWELVAAGLIGAMILTVILVNGWMQRRRRVLLEAGAQIGLAALANGQRLIVPLVPLIDQPGAKYYAILSGHLNGSEVGFFDLFVTAGSQWNLQSTVLLRDLEVAMPMFQLRTSNWLMLNQRIRGDPVNVPGREHEMRGLKLSSNDPDWAQKVFSHAPEEFLEKVRRGKWTIEGLEQSVIVYQWGTRVAPRRLETYIQQAAELGHNVLSICRPKGRSFS